MIRNIFRRILSLASALAIVFTAYPPVIFADDGGLCPHHPEHTAECGYVEGVSPCNFVCKICGTPEPEVTTSPEEQPSVTTAPEPEPVETLTTEATPEESETMPTEPLPEPDSSPAEPEVQMMSLEAEPHNHVEDGIEWTAWAETDSLPDSAGSYYLTTDVTLSNTWKVSGNVNLCLNGWTVTGNFYGYMIQIDGGSLTVYDCKDNLGKIGCADKNTCSIRVYSGNFTLEGGQIYSATNGRAIIVAPAGTAAINNGEIIAEPGYALYLDGGSLNINGGKISASEYYAVYITTGNLTLSGNPIISSYSTYGELADIYFSPREGSITPITINQLFNPPEGETYSISAKPSITISVFATVSGELNAADYAKYFTSANGSLTVVAEGNSLKLVERPKHIHKGDSTEFQPWVSADSLPTEAGNYYLTEDVIISSIVTIKPYQNIKLCLNGHNVNFSTSAANYMIGNGCSLTIYDCGDGEISGNSGNSIITLGGGTFTLESGKITNTNNYANVINCSSGSCYIKGGVVSGGGGINATGGTLTISGGQIIGGLKPGISSQGVLIINGGDISSSTVYAVNVTGGSFNLSGSPTIHSDNSADIGLSKSCVITIDEDLQNKTPYTITADPGVFANVEGGLNAEEYIKNFTSANDDYAVVADGNSLKLVEVHRHTDGEEFLPWDGKSDLTEGKYYLVDNTDIGAGVIIKGDVTLCLNGKTLNCGEDNLYITSGNSLTVCDCSNDKVGKISSTTNKVPINIDSGSFTLESGTISAANSNGSAIQVGGNGSSATIIDGIVESDNVAISAVDQSSTVIVKGGEIKGGSEKMSYGIFSYAGIINISGGTITSSGDCAVRIYNYVLEEEPEYSILGGTLEISNNPAIKGVGADIQLDGTSVLTIAESLTGGPYVIDGVADRVFATGDGVEASIGCFTLTKDLTDEGYVIVAEDGGLKAVVKHEHEDETNFETKWDNETELPSDEGIYFLTKDVTLSANWDVNSDITLCLNGHKIDCGGSYININGAGSLTVYDDPDKEGEITGGGTQTINVDGGKFTLESGTVSGNAYVIKAIENSTVTINGGEIKGYYEGIESKGEVIIRGGKITSSTINCFAVSVLESGHLTISGNPELKSIAGSAEIGLASKALTVDGELTGENKYRIGMEISEPRAFADGKFAVQSADKFTSSNSDYRVEKVGSELWLVPKDAHVHDDGTIFMPWESSNSLPATAGNYYLKNDVNIDHGTWSVNGDTKLCLDGHKITFGSVAWAEVPADASLTVYDCNGAGSIVGGSLHCINNVEGTFTLEGGTIESGRGDEAIYAGSGKIVINGGIVNGKITGDYSGYSITITGGQINGEVSARGDLNISGGTITSSSMAVSAMSSFTLSGKPTIKGEGGVDISLSSPYSPPITINEKLEGGPYSIEAIAAKYNLSESCIIASGAGAVASIGCFKLTDELESAGYEIAAVDSTLVARLRTYTIKYESGEGDDISGDSFTETKTHGKDITISDKIFTRPEYTQIGWSTEQVASEVKYAFGAEYADNADLTLYPVWEKNEIHFYVDGKEATGSLSLKVGESAEISVKITPDGAECGSIQWRISGDEICSIDPVDNTAKITATAGGVCTLTATTDGVLTRNSISIMVVRLDPTVSADDQTVTYGDDVTITAKIEKAVSNGIALMAYYDNKVTFMLGYNVLGTADVVGDTATLTIPATRANGFVIGNNTVILQYSGSGELEHSSRTVKVNVTPKPLTATITGTTSKTYDGTTSADGLGLELELSGVVEGDTVGVSAEFAYDSANAGERTISAENAALTGESAGYYVLNEIKPISGKIDPKAVTIKLTDGDFTYDGEPHMVTATVEGAVEGDEFEIEYTGNTATEAGNYTAKVISLGNANYTLSGSAECEWKIAPRVAEIEWTGEDFAYDGKSHTVTATVKNAVAGDKFEIEYTGNTATESGDYTAKVTDLGNANYALNGATGIEHKWKITALSLADAQVEIVGTYTYNGELQAPEIIVTLGDKVLSAGDYTVTYSGEVKDANTYTVTITGTGNYSGSVSAEFEIAPKLLTARISGTLSKVYDGTVDVNDDVRIALSGVIGTDGVTATSEISYDSANAGTRKIVAKNITLSGEDAKNYALASTQAEVSGSITPAPIDLPNTEFIYSGEAKTVIQISGIGETVTATLTAFSSDAGEYEYSETAKEGGYTVELSSENYAVSKAETLTIKPRVAVIEWQGGEFTYDGTVHEVTATVENAVAGDEFEIEYTGNTATEAGDYTAKVTALGNANYALNNPDALQWSILPAVAEFTWVGDTFAYDGQEHSVSAEVKKVAENDEFVLKYNNEKSNKVGSYTAEVTSLGNSNYTLDGSTSKTHAWSISKSALTVATLPTAADITYGQSLSDSALAGGVVMNGKTAVSGSFAWVDGDKTPAVKDSGKSFAIVFTPDDSSYDPVEAEATITISKAVLTPKIGRIDNKVYDGGTVANGVITLSGAKFDDVPTATAKFNFIDKNAGKNKSVNVSDITLSEGWSDNYELSTGSLLNQSTNAEILPRPAEIEWTGADFTYDGTVHEVTATVKNAVDGDKFNITNTGNTATEAGNYTAEVTDLGNENYTLNGAARVEHKWKITALSIAEAEIEIVGTYTYNGEVQTPEIRVTLDGKVLSADDYTVTYSDEVKDANTYTVTLTGTGNYSGNASAEFEIAPKSLTANISGTLSKIYDGTTEVNDDVKIAVTGVIGTDDVKATSEFSYDSANAGARKIIAKNITLSGETAKNYALSSKQAEISGSITPAPIDLPDSEFIYGGEAKTVIQVSGIGETVTATLTAFSSNAGEYEYSEAAKESCYTVELSSKNYKVQSAGTLTIKPLVAVLEWQSDEFTYDGTVHEVAATVKNAIVGDEFKIEYTGNTANAAGDYTAKVTALGNTNYTLETANEYEWEIAPRAAEIEWVGEEYTYDGEPHTVTATVKNAVMGDKFNITYTNNTATEAGDYTAKVTDLGNENYTLNGATGIEHKWKITAASQAAPEVEIDFINETLSTDETMEFSVDGETWQDCTAAMNVAKTGWNGSVLTVKIRYKKDANHLDGEIQSLVIPARRAAPDISETTVSKSQTEISIAEIAGCEYSLDGVTWQDNGSFSELDNGETYEIHIRYKATASVFASFISQKTVVTSSTADGTTELLPGETVEAGDGSIKNLGGEIIIDDGAGNETTVTLPDGGSVEVDEQGNVTVPGGGEVAVGDNPAVSLPVGGKVEPDGTVIADEVKIGNTDVKGEEVTVTPDGNITVPGEGQVKVGDNPEITLPTGGMVEPDGTVIADEVKIGNTDVKGDDVTIAPNGNITVPGEGSVKVGDNPEITLPTGGTVEPDGTVTADEVKIGDTDVKGENVTVTPDGNITVPGEGSVKVGDNPEIILPTGGTVEPDGTVTADEVKIGNTDVKGEDVTVSPDGNITVPGEGSVKVGDNPEITLPTGGTVEPDGTVIADEVKVGDTDVKGEDVTVTPDGNITVPGEGQVTVGDNPEIILPTGGTVEPDGTVIADEVKVGNTDVKGEDVTVTPDGKITLPEGGKVSVDGEPEKIVPVGATVVDGKIDAPAIAEPVDGESLGDSIILKIEPADERLETADRENLKDAANAIVHEVYDIELLKNGIEVQPDRSIKLTVSADIGGAKMKVFMLDDDGIFTEIDAEFDTENGKFIVVTDSLGIFILASEEGQITSEVVASGGAPEVEISDDDRKILEENLFTDEDETAIENGDNVKVVMNVDGVSEEDVPADDIAEIEAFLDDLDGCEVAEYADITLTKITEDGVTGDEIRSEAISEINNPIKLVIDIPETLHKAGRVFSVIRLHDGKAELLNDTDQSDDTVTILTDKFSLYVLIYRDPASQPSHVHSFSGWVSVGEAGHRACCICGKTLALMPHTFRNGVCTMCGYIAQLPDDSETVNIEVPTEGKTSDEEMTEF